jgi:hypothetical protein
MNKYWALFITFFKIGSFTFGGGYAMIPLIEKEIVENFINQKEPRQIINCPDCNSDNTAFGYAIDFKWDVLYLIFYLLIWTPFFPIRKKYHCFDCGHDFKKIGKTATANNGS